MKQKKILGIILLPALALIILVIFQTRWIGTAHQLREEQFDQQVSMALCGAIDKLSQDSAMCKSVQSCLAKNPSCLPKPLAQNTDALDSLLRKSLERYHINLDFQFQLSSTRKIFPVSDALLGKYLQNNPHQCSLNPVTNLNGWEIQVFFPEKNNYLLKQMRFMLISSLVVIGFILLFLILTIRKIWRQELMAERNINFFNNMAHEFQTPLTNIRLATRMLEKNGHSAKQRERLIEIIQHETQKLSKEVSSILQISKMADSGPFLRKSSFDLHEIALKAINSLALQIEDKEAKIKTFFQAEKSMIIGDYEKLLKVFTNLLDNSIKYSPKPADITISTLSDQNGISFIIKDQGIGMTQVQLEQIFDRFYRAPSGDLHQIKGFGLGLSFVKMVIEAHKGSINVKSKPNKGAEFQIFLPFTKQTYATENSSYSIG